MRRPQLSRRQWFLVLIALAIGASSLVALVGRQGPSRYDELTRYEELPERFVKLAAQAPPAASTSTRGMAEGGSLDAMPAQSVEPAAASPPAEAQAPSPRRMVHYNAWLKLRVADQADALTAASQHVVAVGGYVERLGATSVTVRVPAQHFEATVAALMGLGELLERTISAEDVTDAYLSVDLRLRTARETRQRLEALLSQADTEEEKLHLLAQIQRVTDEIERLELSLKTLADLAALSRITLEVEPRLKPGTASAEDEVRGLKWIRALSPFDRSVIGLNRRVALETPTGMVALHPKGPYTAEGPDGAALWTRVMENTPAGDTTFWAEALKLRLEADFAVVEPLDLGGFSGWRLVDRGDNPYTWILAVRVVSDTVQLVQAYFPTAESEARHKEAVLEAIKVGGAS